MSGWINAADGQRLALLVVATWGNTCHLCRRPIDLSLSRRDPQGMSIDHLTPRSRGGSNAVENLRPAHLVCNVRRGARELTPPPPHQSDLARFFRRPA